MDKLTLAPILLFTYNRPLHTRRLVESLRRNAEARQSHLIVYSDGPRTPEASTAVAETRRYLHTITGFRQVEIIERAENRGLSKSIIGGVTEQLERYGRVIVLEDDLVVAPHFLRFMNNALEAYEDDTRVGHIQACDFTGNPALPPTFFIRWTGSWGWATWQRAWQLFNPDGQALLDELERRKLTRRFDFGGAYPFTRMLRRQVEGRNDSWAIRWNASLFLAGVLSLNAGRSLVLNDGFDGSGTHCGGGNLYRTKLWTKPLPINLTAPVKENEDARRCLARYYRRHFGFWAKAVRRIRRTLRGDFGR